MRQPAGHMSSHSYNSWKMKKKKKARLVSGIDCELRRRWRRWAKGRVAGGIDVVDVVVVVGGEGCGEATQRKRKVTIERFVVTMKELAT